MTEALERIRAGLKSGDLIPYLGPATLLIGGAAPVPASHEDLAAALCARTGVPGRIRGNVWSAAQYIESRKHRLTLKRLMEAIFANPVPPGRLHHWLASLHLPLIVDCWYDGAMATALTAAGGAWGQAQAVTRNGKNEDIWYRFLNPDNSGATGHDTLTWPTLLYKPHGAILPHGEFLLSDSDYVEVLTEIDIQSPIPVSVIERRTPRGFVFLGCRFRDQMDRIFARQIMKRSAGPHYAVIEGELTKNEERFLDEQHIEQINKPLACAVTVLTA